MRREGAAAPGARCGIQSTCRVRGAKAGRPGGRPAFCAPLRRGILIAMGFFSLSLRNNPAPFSGALTRTCPSDLRRCRFHSRPTGEFSLPSLYRLGITSVSRYDAVREGEGTFRRSDLRSFVATEMPEDGRRLSKQLSKFRELFRELESSLESLESVHWLPVNSEYAGVYASAGLGVCHGCQRTRADCYQASRAGGR